MNPKILPQDLQDQTDHMLLWSIIGMLNSTLPIQQPGSAPYISAIEKAEVFDKIVARLKVLKPDCLASHL